MVCRELGGILTQHCSAAHETGVMQASFSGRIPSSGICKSHSSFRRGVSASVCDSAGHISQRVWQRRPPRLLPPRTPLPCGCSSGGERQYQDSGNIDIAQSKAALREALQAAIHEEDYSRAAALKAELHELELRDPLVSLRLALDAAVEEERYQVLRRAGVCQGNTAHPVACAAGVACTCARAHIIFRLPPLLLLLLLPPRPWRLLLLLLLLLLRCAHPYL
jgi:hypothetical protein